MRDLLDAVGAVLLSVLLIIGAYALFLGTLRVLVWITKVLILGA